MNRGVRSKFVLFGIGIVLLIHSELCAGSCGEALAWTSDSHLDFLSPEQIDKHLDSWANQDFSRLMISGDISSSIFLIKDLKRIVDRIERELLVVLGNHDYWGPYRMQEVRNQLLELQEREARFKYVPAQDLIHIDDSTALVGIDGWGSGPWPFELVGTEMRDFERIPDLREVSDLSFELFGLSRRGLQPMLSKIRNAFDSGYERVFLLTHVPAFSDLVGDDPNLLYVNEALGSAILQLMKDYPSKSLRVFAGHTHRESETAVLPNLTQSVFGTEYRDPSLPKIVE